VELGTAFVMGILLGGLYGLVALGLSLIFGVVREMNLAHGDFVVLGSYFAYTIVTACGIDPILSLALGVPVFLVIGYVLQRFLLNYACRISHDTVLLVTFGISVVLQNVFPHYMGSAIPKFDDSLHPLRVGLWAVSHSSPLFIGFFSSRSLHDGFVPFP